MPGVQFRKKKYSFPETKKLNIYLFFIVIALQLTISSCSVITSYNTVSHKLPSQIFTTMAIQTKTEVYVHFFLFQGKSIFLI
jgi:hypothetical protein